MHAVQSIVIMATRFAASKPFSSVPPTEVQQSYKSNWKMKPYPCPRKIMSAEHATSSSKAVSLHEPSVEKLEVENGAPMLLRHQADAHASFTQAAAPMREQQHI
mmetsp:Transcript_3201/g.8495  ORF Transcript_3201/g.8495 Transcript_3201/m.8495 type:complete len:104 (+) Transcript_3201:311-622(+)